VAFNGVMTADARYLDDVADLLVAELFLLNDIWYFLSTSVWRYSALLYIIVLRFTFTRISKQCIASGGTLRRDRKSSSAEMARTSSRISDDDASAGTCVRAFDRVTLGRSQTLPDRTYKTLFTVIIILTEIRKKTDEEQQRLTEKDRKHHNLSCVETCHV